jgi:CubicO group peptidase (beta-lactamase class C family)
MMALLTRRDVLKLGAVLTVGACAPRVLRGVSREARFDWTLHSPDEVGMSPSGLEGIRAAIQTNIDNKVIPGAVTAIARHNKLVWYEAQGVRDVETGAPMAKDDLFRMMSGTKPVTAVAVLLMMDEGKLSLDDKVSRFIPTFKDPKVAEAPAGAKDASQVKLVPANREITIKDLLTHTSGLSSAGDDLGPGPGSLVNKIERKPDDTLADYIPRLGSAALDFQPGTKWRYSPVEGFDVLLRIVEITSGKQADEFMRERIFEPLDMGDTYFNVPPEKKARVVNVYGRQGGNWKVEKPLLWEVLGEDPVKYFCGCGGLFSTVHDYMQFEAMLLNRGTLNGRKLLKPETVALMSRNHVGTLFAEWIPGLTDGHGFGLGVRIVEDEAKGSGRGIGAFGWGGAYGTETWADPELDVAAAMFIQVEPGPPDVKTDFQQALRKAIVA